MASKVAYIPLGGSVGARLINPQGAAQNVAQLLENVIPIIFTEDVSGKKYLKLYSRPGYATKVAAGGASVKVTRGMVWTGVAPSNLISVGVIPFAGHDGSNVILYQLDGGVSTLGTYVGAYECVGIQETLLYSGASQTPNLTLNIRKIASPYNQKALFFPNGGALTEITDGDFPTNTIGQFAHMDGYAFIMDVNGNIWNSDLNSLSAWTSTSYLAASGQPGLGVGVARMKNLIVGLKLNSIDFFENVGNATGSPLQRIPQAALKIGARHSGCVLPFNDQIAFVGISEGATGVYLLSGFTAKKISTPWIDQYIGQTITALTETPIQGGNLASIQGGGVSLLGTAVFHGNQIVILSCAGLAGNLQALFGYIVGTDDTWISIKPALGFASANAWTGFFQSASTNYMIQTLNNSQVDGIYNGGIFGTSSNWNLTQDGAAATPTNFTWTVITHRITHGTDNRKQTNGVSLIGDKQVSIAASTANVLIEYSDDDGKSFTTYGTVDMCQSPRIVGKGRHYRQRMWRLSGTGSPCILDGMAETFDVLEN